MVLTGAYAVARPDQLRAMLKAGGEAHYSEFRGVIVGGKVAGSILVNLLEIAESIQRKQLVSKVQFE